MTKATREEQRAAVTLLKRRELDERSLDRLLGCLQFLAEDDLQNRTGITLLEALAKHVECDRVRIEALPMRKEARP